MRILGDPGNFTSNFLEALVLRQAEADADPRPAP
jgi:hypothetical protein